MDIITILVQKGLLDKKDTDSIKEEAVSSGLTLEQVLIKRGISPQDILVAKGDYFDVPTKNITDLVITERTLSYIPEDSASHYRFVPLAVTKGVLEVGMVNPDDIEARDALNFISTKTGMPFKIYLITETDFEKVFSQYKGFTAEVSKSLSELENELKIETSEAEERVKAENEASVAEESQIAEDAPVTKIVATILRYATDGNASDIHIEPWRENVRVRFRVDGVMNTSLMLPSKVHPAVVARIKILSEMRLDEKRKPQDGRFTTRVDERKIDFRVSTFPTYFGEKVVMRLLDQEKGVKGLDELEIGRAHV